jgi:quercetin dioxygenase-like cupin family protein
MSSPMIRIPAGPGTSKGPWEWWELVPADSRLEGAALAYQILRGGSEPSHTHDDYVQLWIADEGSAVATVGDEVHEFKPGCALWITPGMPHGLSTDSEIKFWSIHLPDRNGHGHDHGDGHGHDH